MDIWWPETEGWCLDGGWIILATADREMMASAAHIDAGRSMAEMASYRRAVLGRAWVLLLQLIERYNDNQDFAPTLLVRECSGIFRLLRPLPRRLLAV